MIKFILLGAALACVVLFVAGLVAPERSRRMQRWVAGRLWRGEKKAEARGDRPGDVASASLEKAREATNRSADAGRETHEKLTS